MRALLALLAVAFVAAPLSGCIGTFETVESLGWKPGYSFAFESTESGSESAKQYENGTEVASSSQNRDDEKDTTQYQVLSVDDKLGDETWAIVVVQPLTGSARLRAYSTRDMSEGSVDVDDDEIEIRSNFRDGLVRFPISADQSYEESQDEFEAGFTKTVTVEGAEHVDGPDGRVEAIRIRHDIEVDAEAMRIEIEGDLSDEGGHDIDVTTNVDATRTVWYAPSLHNIVRDEQSATFDYDVSYTDDEGVRHRSVFEGTFDGLTVLTKATFAVGDDLDAKGILKALKIGAHPGAVVPDVGVGTTIKLTGSGGTVGVTSGTDLDLKVQTGALESPVNVELTGPSGTQRVQVPAGGGDVSLAVDKPGQYTWTASTTGDDQIASTVLKVGVDLHDVIESTCPTGTVQGTCDPVSFALPQGMSGLTVVAQREPLLLEPGFATLRVETPDGDYTDDMLASNTATVTLDQPPAGGYVVNLEFQGIGNAVTFTITGSVPAPSASKALWFAPGL